MAFTDYKYIGYEDEYIITKLILTNFTRVCKASKDRLMWLESKACEISAATDTVHTQGGAVVGKAQRYVEELSSDPILRSLKRIEMGVMTKLKLLSPKEKLVIEKSFITAEPLTAKQISDQYNIKLGSVKSLKSIALNKLINTCVRVYKDFCTWRAYDDRELVNRARVTDEEIQKELKKRLGAAY